MPLDLIHHLLSIAVLLLGPPLLLGAINRTKAAFAGRQGPPLLQPYLELRRLWHKSTVFSTATALPFRLGPIVSVATALLALTLIPLAGHAPLLAFRGDMLLLVYLLALGRFAIALAALDTASPFEGMGSAREVTFGALAEPALLLGLIILVRLTGSTSLSVMLAPALTEHWTAGAASLVLVAISWFVVMLAENSRIPFDDPNTHLELTMVHEVMVLDHSGPLLGLVHYAAALKLFVYAALLQRILIPRSVGPWLDWVVFAAGVLAIAVAIGVAESMLARVRLLAVPRLLVAASLASIFGVLLLTRA